MNGKEDYIRAGGWEDGERVFCESWPPCSGVTSCHSLLPTYLSVHSQLPSYWKKHRAVVHLLCSVRIWFALCHWTSRWSRPCYLRLTDKDRELAQDHSAGGVQSDTTCEGRNALAPRCVWLQSPSFSFCANVFQIQSKTSVALDCTEAGSHVAQVASDSYVAGDDIKLFNLLPQPHRC